VNAAPPRPAWNDEALRHLLDGVSCAVCGAQGLRDRRCPACGADYSRIGTELWDASQAAAAALQARQAVLERVPRLAPAPAPRVAAPTPQAAVVAGARTDRTAAAAGATVQSVLAVAGAGLVAVAAIVFTFFNPDLTDGMLRDAVIAVVTVGFLVGSRLLVRRGLRFSAEAVGALGMVFLGLDVDAFARLAPAPLDPWTFAAIGTLVAGAAMTGLAVRSGIRVWLLLSLAGLAFVPVMLGLGIGGELAIVAGWLGTGVAAFALGEATRSLARRFDGRLRTERVLLTVIAFGAVARVVTTVLGIERVSAG